MLQRKLLCFFFFACLVWLSKAQIPILSTHATPHGKLLVLETYVQECFKNDKFAEAKKAAVLSLVLAQHANVDSSIAKAYYNLGFANKNQANFDSAIYYFNLLQELPFPVSHKLRVKAKLCTANAYENIGEMDSVFAIMGRLEKDTHLHHDSLNAENIYFLLFYGVLREDKGDYDKALQYYQRGLKMARVLKDTFNTAYLCHNIGIFYSNLDNPQKAIRFFKEADNYYALQGKSSSLRACTLYRTMGIDLARVGKLEEGIDYANKAIRIAQQLNINDLLEFCYSGIGGIYLDNKDLGKAELYYKKSLELIKDTDLKFSLLTVYGQLGQVKLKQKKYHEAKVFFEKANTLAIALAKKSSIASSFNNLSETEAALGNYSKAYYYHKIYVTYQDSLTTELSNRNLAEMEAKYQSEQKEQQIALLGERDKSQTLQLKNQQQVQYLSLAGLCFVVVIVALFWRNYRVKQLLQVQHVRNQIAADLHDDIGSTMSSIALSSELAAKRARNILPAIAEEFDRIGKKSRETVVILQDTIWAIHTNRDQDHTLLDRMKLFAIEIFSSKDIDHTFEVHGLPKKPIFEIDVQKNIYLVFKEAITNIAKHANATQVAIVVTAHANELELVIRDNGVGFDTTIPTTGNGLHNFEVRATALKGAVKITSSDTGGTQLILRIPLPNFRD